MYTMLIHVCSTQVYNYMCIRLPYIHVHDCIRQVVNQMKPPVSVVTADHRKLW